MVYRKRLCLRGARTPHLDVFQRVPTAVLDCFLWKSKHEGESVFGATAFDSTDPRLDHRGVRVYLQIAGVGTMPTLETLFRPMRLKMTDWASKRHEWQRRVALALEYEGSENGRDMFAHLDNIKRVALDQARSLLGRRQDAQPDPPSLSTI
jgi:hypothetical protein